MIIDAYAHVCPLRFIEAISKVRPSAESDALRSNRYLWDVEARLRYMDANEIDIHVLVMVRPPMWLGIPRPQIHDLVKVANESIAEIVNQHPDRFVGVGVMPVVDDATMAEFEAGQRNLGLRGTLVFSTVDGEPIDCAANWALFKRCAELDVPIWIHPQLGAYYPWSKRDLLDRSLGWPFDTSLAMARLAYSGVFEQYPDIKFVTHHMGGMIPFYQARMDDFDAIIGEYASEGIGQQSTSRPTGRISDHLRRFYCDANVSGSSSSLRCGIEYFTTDHVMYGTDFPMGEHDGEKWPLDQLRSIRALDLPAVDRDKILAGNASRLLRLSRLS